MDGYHSDKRYESLKIPDRQQILCDGATHSSPPAEATPSASLAEATPSATLAETDPSAYLAEATPSALPAQTAPSASPSESMYYEIDYDSCPIPGAGKFVLKSQKIAPREPAEKDEIRERFQQMRDISRQYRPASIYSSRFLDRSAQQDHAFVFYKQGLFMKDFTDDYAGNTPFSQYFPCYQLMNHEQLRTYFTWRTAVRNGIVADTSLSNAFLYLYELLGNIGVSSPQDGLDKLMFFWKAFQVHNKTIDKYVIRWLKDYHIYYELPHSFKEFVTENHLAMHYPNMADKDDNFSLFCAISKYDIRKSAFFTDDRAEMITDCFHDVITTLKQVFVDNGIHFDNSIFEPAKGMTAWTPFKDALFSPWIQQTDRRIVLSENEIYLCKKNKWTFSTVITNESGKAFIGYVMKQMEAVLRTATQYKYKLSANISMVTHAVIGKLNGKGLSLEKIVTDAVIAFYREATKTIVKVDHQALSSIRREALATQKKLTVPDQEVQIALFQAPHTLSFPMPQKMPPSHDLSSTTLQQMPPIPTMQQEQEQEQEQKQEPASANTIWTAFGNTLSETELQALSVLIHGNMEFKKFADECGIMLEVLVDGINEKAMDSIGDNLMDDAFNVYDDYIEDVKELLR